MTLTPPPPTTLSFEKSAIPLSLIVKPSRLYIVAVVAIHLLTMAAIISAVLPQTVQWILSLMVAVSLLYNVVVARRTRSIVWHTGNHWSVKQDHLQQGPPDYRHAALTSVDFLSRWLVIITLKETNKSTERFVIPFDSMNKDSYRLFRVRLRIEGHGLMNPNDPTRAE